MAYLYSYCIPNNIKMTLVGIFVFKPGKQVKGKSPTDCLSGSYWKKEVNKTMTK